MKNIRIADSRTIWFNEKSNYNNLGKEITDTILNILKINGISAKVTYRTKDTDSLIKKIARKDSSYDAIHDKVGVRIVTHFKEQMTIIDDLLKLNFNDAIVKREDMADKLGDNVFGYQSIHYDFCKSENGKEYFCEIQLRTICQDNWSELSHALAYKTEISLPQRITREINALSAVFELADNQFQLIQSLISKLPDTNPIKILNHIEKFYYTYLGNSYDKELSGYFLKNIQTIYNDENPIIKLNDFITGYHDLVVTKTAENLDNFFFSQPEIVVILERLQNRKYDFVFYWDDLYPHEELEEIANIWGTSID